MPFHKFSVTKCHFHIISFRAPFVNKSHMFLSAATRWHIDGTYQTEPVQSGLYSKLFLKLSSRTSNNGILTLWPILSPHMSASPNRDFFM